MLIQSLKLFDQVYCRNIKPLVFRGETSVNSLSEPIVDTVEISPKSTHQMTSLNFEEAQNISGIHCPVCGQKMLPPKDYINIINKADKVETTTDLIKILKEYHEYIPEISSTLLSDITKIHDYDKITVQKLVIQLAKLSYEQKKQAIEDGKNYLSYIALSYTDEKKVRRGLKIISEIDSKDKYYIFRKKVNKFANAMGLSEQEKYMIRGDLLKNVIMKELYFDNFFIKNTPEMRPGELAKILVASIFSETLCEIHDVSPLDKFKLNPNNKVLICKSCGTNKCQNAFWKKSDAPNLKENITKYLMDITLLMGKEKISYNKHYIKNICNAVNKLSSDNFTFREEEINYLQNLRRIFSRHEEFLPIEQTKVDIPCADCGSIMLPHETREIIKDELFDCQTPSDYVKILKKYNKYIGKYSRDLVATFIKLYEENPQMSNDEFVQEYKNRVKKYCKDKTEDALGILLDGRTYFVNTHQIDKVRFMDEVYDIMSDYIKAGNYSDCKYYQMYRECFKRGNYNKQSNIFIARMQKKLRTISFQYSMAYIPENVQYNVKDDLYAIVFSLFNTDTATVDHLLAKSKGGKKDKNNLIGLCKGCNTIKGSKNVLLWLDNHKSVKSNLPKQMKIIDAMAYRKQINGYENWAEDIAQQMYELTEGKFDIRYQFEK